MMTLNPFDIAGRVVVVTGAGSGIGRAAAQMLDGMGVIVVGTDLNATTAGETAGQFVSGGIALQHDVTNEADWDRVMSEVRSRFGKLNVLVNNAGVMMNRGFDEMTLDVLHQQLRVNVDSVFLGMKAAMPLLCESSGSASIINISSIYGQVAGSRFSAYCASKGAVLMLSKAVAHEYASRGVRVNSVHPGPTNTNLMSNWQPMRGPDGQEVPWAVALAAAATVIPMKRFGEASEMAAMIAFLAGDASSYITGAEMVVDGGYTAI
jgi:NAD(P)-dependent dehydrogenase (short-subunit alcohol dehydrogenase family)